MSFYPNDLLTNAVLITLQLLAGLLCIWVGTSKLPWFWRGVVVLGVIAALIPPRAYDVAVGLLIQTAATGIAIGLARRWNQRNVLPLTSSWRFHLVDLLHVVFILCGGLALMTYLLRQRLLSSVPLLVLVSVLHATLTSFILAVVFAKRRLFRLILLLLVAVMMLAVSTLECRISVGEEMWPLLPDELMSFVCPFLIRNVITYVLLLLVVGLTRYVALNAIRTNKNHWSIVNRLHKACLAIAGVWSAAIVFFIWWRMAFLPAPPEVVVPSPNGFDTVLEAAKLVQGDSLIHPDVVPRATLKAFVDSNQPAIQLAHEGLRQPWHRTLSYDFNTYSDDPFPNSAELRSLVRTLCCAARLAGKERRLNDAVTNNMDAICLSVRLRSGGLLIDYLVALALQGVSFDALKGIRQELGADQYRRTITILQELAQQGDSISDTLERDRIWSVHNLGYQAALQDAIASLRGQPVDASWYRHYALPHAALWRMLLLDMAIRLYRIENAHLPRTLQDLVPSIIDKLPQDPFTNRSFIYRIEKDDRFSLYSAGPDHDDDGGRMLNWQAIHDQKDGDFFLDQDETNPTLRSANAPVSDLQTPP